MFPIFVEIKTHKCVVAGGGKVAERKIKVLAEYCENITVISPALLPSISQLPVRLINRKLERNDLLDAFLVIAATDDKELNDEIVRFCNERKIWVNSATKTSGETFAFPAVVKRGEVTIGINSGGVPSLSKKLKQMIVRCLPDDLDEISRNLLDARNTLLQATKNEELKNEMNHMTEAAFDDDKDRNA
ncbi:MAG: cysG [Oscillospiraceae bacterium]|jgi:siroheme synthase-like protein|nr:cysG [Oscillospiraceae bacterium]